MTHRLLSRSGYLAVALCLLFAFSMGLLSWALYSRFSETNERRLVQQEFNARIAAVSLEYCLEIEKLKTAQREDALEAFSNLDRNLKLLKIERTPELQRIAIESRDRDLRRFRNEPCPRPIQKEDP